jgi:hypothetical protein
MWIFTTIGFFSIVQKPRTDFLTVRARVTTDLDNPLSQSRAAKILSPGVTLV